MRVQARSGAGGGLLGADYIIGVNLSQPRTYSEINGMSELLLQCISLMGKDALDVTVPLADVYIKPDMSGMNMMSFIHSRMPPPRIYCRPEPGRETESH